MDNGVQILLFLIALYNALFRANFKDNVKMYDQHLFSRKPFHESRDLNMAIHVFSWRRTKSLQRLCNSLLKARYLDYKVPLIFHVDGEPLASVVTYLDAFRWPFGEKIVLRNPQHLGMPDV